MDVRRLCRVVGTGCASGWFYASFQQPDSLPHHSELKLSLGMYEQLDCFLKSRNYGHALTNCVCDYPKKYQSMARVLSLRVKRNKYTRAANREGVT